MDQPAASRKTSAAEATAPLSALSTSSAPYLHEAETHTHLSVPVSSSTSSSKSQCDVFKTPLPSQTSFSSSSAIQSDANSVSASGSGAGSAMDRTLRSQEDARKLQFALAQQQVQQYQAMTKQLESQSGIAMTPSASVAGLAKTSEDLQKLRTEQLARLQQNVRLQAQMAAQAVQKHSNDEWLRNKLLREQEQLQLIRLQQTGNTVTSAAATSIADGLLAQQQQVLKQQQMLRDMLQKQQKQQQAQRALQLQLHKSETDIALKKRKFKTTFDMDLEALARVCIRVANARTDCEMRQALDRMTTWLHRCSELQLLQLAQRDYQECLAHRRPMLVHQERWPLDLQVKSEFITQKIAQLVAAVEVREKNRVTQQQATGTTTGTARTTTTYTVTASATVASNAGVSSSSSTSAATPVVMSTEAITTTAADTIESASNVPTPSKTTNTSPTTTIMAPAVRISEKRDMVVVEREYAELKAQMQAKQVEINQKAKAKRDALKLEAAQAASVVSDEATTSAMLAAAYKRPLQVEIPNSTKKPRTDSYVVQSLASTAYRPSTTSIPAISPRVAQQFYDLDLSTRTSTESEDKMYLPPKMISKIMYKALPGSNDESGDPGVTVKQEGISKSKSPAAVSSSVMSSVLPVDPVLEPVSISDEAVTFMQECVTEFLLYFTSEARDRSIMQNRRTTKGVGLSISGSNVVESMENLGFITYARVLAGYNEKVKASQDAASHKKMERKRLVKQQAMRQAAATAAASSAANAAKITADKNAVKPQSYQHPGLKPVVVSQYVPSSTILSVTTTATKPASTTETTTAPSEPRK